MKKKFEKTHKCKVIRIILDTQTKSVLKDKSEKYHLSMSTIAKCLYLTYYSNLDQATRQQLMETYLVKDGKETTIKPRMYEIGFKDSTQETKFLSNLLYLYANNQLKSLTKTEKDHKELTNILNNKLQTEKETFWNLNETIRTQKRALRMLGVLQK